MAKRDKLKVVTTFERERDGFVDRADLMTDDAVQLAGKIQEWYRDSYEDKDSRGIFDKMEAAELYWEGDQHPAESDFDPASNTNIVNSTIEGMVAYLVEQNLAVEAKPRGPSDLAFRNKAVALMEWCIDQNRMRRKIDVHERRRKKFGTGVFRVIFDHEALGGFGLPRIEPVNPGDVFLDPTVKDIYKIQEGRYIIERIPRSIESARELYGDDWADAIQPGYYPNEVDGAGFGDDTAEPFAAADADGQYMHWLVWTHAWVDDEDAIEQEASEDDFAVAAAMQDGGVDADESSDDPQPERPAQYRDKKKVLRLIEMSACGLIFRDTLSDGVPICEDDNRFPYFLTPDMFREGTAWGKATAELLIPEQDAINDVEDAIRINARLTGNPQRVLDTNSGIDPDKLTNEPGLVIPSDQGTNGLEWIQPPGMPTYIINYRTQKLQYERTVVSRWSDQMNGVKQSGVDTATESLGLQQAGTQNISHDKALLEETLGEVMEYCLILMMENYTETEIFRITENGEDTFRAINPSGLKQIPTLVPTTPEQQMNFMGQFPMAEQAPEFMPHPEGLTQRVALDIKVTMGAGLPSNKAFMWSMIQSAMQAGMITPPEARKLAKEYIGLPIAEEPPAPPMPPPMPGMPGGPPQNPLVQGLSAGGQPMPGGGA